MKRFSIFLSCIALLATPSFATSEFNKQWKAKYLSGDDVGDDFKKAARKQSCYICHVVKQDKKKVQNEYGKSVKEFLKAKDFPRDYVKENPEEVKEKIFAGLEKAGKKKSKDGKVFEDKIKAGLIPATDSGK
ncbi:MAG: hypothetical protein AAF802_04850 [Planctomycetota bacterium]